MTAAPPSHASSSALAQTCSLDDGGTSNRHEEALHVRVRDRDRSACFPLFLERRHDTSPRLPRTLPKRTHTNGRSTGRALRPRASHPYSPIRLGRTTAMSRPRDAPRRHGSPHRRLFRVPRTLLEMASLGFPSINSTVLVRGGMEHDIGAESLEYAQRRPPVVMSVMIGSMATRGNASRRCP